MSYSVKKAGIPFYVKVDTGPDLTGYAANLQAYYIDDATGTKTNVAGSFVEDANTPGLYRLEVTIPSTGDYTIVVRDLSGAGVNVAAPIVVTQATIDDVKNVVDQLSVTLSNVETQVNTLDQGVINQIETDVQTVQGTLNEVKQLINDTDDLAIVVSGDETGILTPGATVTGSTSGATGYVHTATYDSVNNETQVVLHWTSKAAGINFQAGETLTDGTNTTTGTITSVVTGVVNSVLEFVTELNAALQDGASGLAALKGYTDDVENLLLGVATLADGTANPTAGKGLAQIYDRLDSGLTQLTSDLANVQAAIQADIAAAKVAIQNDIANVQSVVDSNSALLNDSSNGLAALKTALDNLSTQLSTHDTDIKAILQAADGGLADIKSTMIARFDAVDSALNTISNKVNTIQSTTSFTVFA